MAIETIFTSTPSSPQQPNHELNRLIEPSSSGTSSTNKKRPAMRRRFVNIFRSRSKSSQTQNQQRRHQQQLQQQQELATLGTIELNSYDEHKFNDDDDEGEDNHGLTSCGSALQLNQIAIVGDSDDRYSSFGSLSSRSQGILDESKDSAEVMKHHEVLAKECGITHTVASLDAVLPTKQSSFVEEKISSYEDRIISLFQKGKELYTNGSYQEALNTQKHALKVVHRKGLFAKKNMDLSHKIQGKKFNSPLHQRQKAMIQYEIAKIKFVIYKEEAYYVADSNEDVQQKLSRLFDKMQDAKCKVSLQDMIYYQDQLSQMEKDYIEHQAHQDTKLPFDKFHTCQKIEILNTLGKICHKDLHRYEDALRYYKVALELECYFLNHITCTTNNNNFEKEDDSYHETEVETWQIKIRQTKRKIGAIHYMNGRFDMALLSSFSYTRSY